MNLMSLDKFYSLPYISIITFSGDSLGTTLQQTPRNEKCALKLEFWNNLKDANKFS